MPVLDEPAYPASRANFGKELVPYLLASRHGAVLMYLPRRAAGGARRSTRSAPPTWPRNWT